MGKEDGDGAIVDLLVSQLKQTRTRTQAVWFCLYSVYGPMVIH